MLKLLIPVDGSDHSKKALTEAIKIAGWTTARLILLHVRNEYITRQDDTAVDHRLYGPEEAEKRSMDLLDQMTEDLNDLERARIEKISRIGNVARLSLVGDVAETITSFAGQELVDYIVMGSQGINAGKIRSVFVGSITRNVLAHAPCPVIVVK